MIFIALNTLFNGFILGVVLQIGDGFLRVRLGGANCMLVGYAVSALLTIVGYSKFAGNLVGIFVSGRKPIGREINRIEPILRRVIEKVNQQFNTSYSYQDFKIRMTDSKIANAFALGYNTITISDGCLKYFDDRQLTAILAHEVAHLYYRDSVRSIALIFSSFATKIIMWCYAVVVVLQAIFANIARGFRNGALLGLISFLPLLMLLPVVVFNWLGTKVFYFLNMALSRKGEYRADAFAVCLGYKTELIEALEILSDLSADDNSFMGKMMATHPAIKLRIGAIEDGVVQKQYFGLFEPGVGFKNAGVNTNNSKELFLLIGYFVFIGVVLYFYAMR